MPNVPIFLYALNLSPLQPPFRVLLLPMISAFKTKLKRLSWMREYYCCARRSASFKINGWFGCESMPNVPIFLYALNLSPLQLSFGVVLLSMTIGFKTKSQNCVGYAGIPNVPIFPYALNLSPFTSLKMSWFVCWEFVAFGRLLVTWVFASVSYFSRFSSLLFVHLMFIYLGIL